MPGGGSIQNMTNALKNNKILLGTKRRLFKSKFQILREDYQIASGIIIKGKKATQEELCEIRSKILQERKRENKILLIILILVLLTLSSFTYLMLAKRTTKSSFKIESTIENQINYTENMAIGLQLMADKKWFYAAGYFENALLQIPNDTEAEYNLALSYSLLCSTKQEACKKANITVNRLIKNNPENNNFKELKSKYLQ